MGLKRNLKIVWDETAFPMDTPVTGSARRYIARAFGDGGYGWGVWDKKENRYLKDREVARLSPEKLRENYAN